MIGNSTSALFELCRITLLSLSSAIKETWSCTTVDYTRWCFRSRYFFAKLESFARKSFHVFCCLFCDTVSAIDRIQRICNNSTQFAAEAVTSNCVSTSYPPEPTRLSRQRWYMKGPQKTHRKHFQTCLNCWGVWNFSLQDHPSQYSLKWPGKCQPKEQSRCSVCWKNALTYPSRQRWLGGYRSSCSMLQTGERGRSLENCVNWYYMLTDGMTQLGHQTVWHGLQHAIRSLLVREHQKDMLLWYSHLITWNGQEKQRGRGAV